MKRSMKRSLISIWLTVLVLILVLGPYSTLVSAYSYGDPGEEEMAEAYKELEKYIHEEEWQSARLVYETYTKEFELYFGNVIPALEKGFENKDADLVLEAYQSALRKNIERRLTFAHEQFDDYGQAKLLLAKGRGTFNVLAPSVAEKEGQPFVDEIYTAFEKALEGLGNPGLFGIGKAESNLEQFEENTTYITGQLKPLFPVPMSEDGTDHLKEEELKGPQFMDDEDSDFWMWVTIGLIGSLVLIIVINRIRKA